MNETNFKIDSAKGLTTYLKSVGCQIKIQNKGAEIILKTLLDHEVGLHTDNEGKLYQTMADGKPEETTIDDVVDLACEYNYEDSYTVGQSVENASDFVNKCKAKKKLDELNAEGRTLNRIFYQTKYGRKVNMVADRICSELFTKLNLVPIYDVPFYEDKMVSEPSSYEVSKVTDKKETLSDQLKLSDDDMKIVAADSPVIVSEEPKEVYEESKGAR